MGRAMVAGVPPVGAGEGSQRRATVEAPVEAGEVELKEVVQEEEERRLQPDMLHQLVLPLVVEGEVGEEEGEEVEGVVLAREMRWFHHR